MKPPSDLESQKETTPLLKDQDEPAMNTEEMMGRWFRKRASVKFRRALFQSFQTAFWVVICAIVPLAIPKGRALFSQYGFNVAYIVCNFLFTVGPNFGATLDNSVQAVLGNFYAFLYLWVMNGLFPGGYAGENHTAFWVGLVAGGAIILVSLILNINETLRFFTLYNLVLYQMAFMDPGDTGGVSAGFSFDFYGRGVSAMMLAFLGAVVAVLNTLFPFHYTAQESLRDGVKSSGAKVSMLLRNLMEYYSGTEQTMDIYGLIGAVPGIKAQINSHATNAGYAWYECNFLTSHFQHKKQIERARLMAISDLQHEVVKHVIPLLDVALREEFEESHKSLMSVSGGDLAKSLWIAIDRTLDLQDLLIQASNAGVLGREPQQTMEDHIGEVEWAFSEVDKNQLGHRGKQYFAESTGECCFVLNLRSIAVLTVKQARDVLEGEHKAEPMNLKAWAKTFIANIDAEHLTWAGRQLLSLFLCMTLGYFGYVSASGTGVPFIYSHNAGPALIVVVLMSKFVGDVFQSALDRVAAVLVAMIVGQMAWVIFGACTAMHRFLTCLAIFWITQPCMYITYMGGQYASLGMRVAAIGTMMALAPCSSTGLNYTDYSNSYHQVIDVIAGVFIMVTVEILFAGDPPSKQLRKAIVKVMHDVEKTFEGYFNDTMSNDEVSAACLSLSGRIDSLASMSTEAAKEPRWFRAPFKAVFFDTVIDMLRQLNSLLHNLVLVMHETTARAGLNRPVCMQLPAFRTAADDLLGHLKGAVKLARPAIEAGGQGKDLDAKDRKLDSIHMKLKDIGKFSDQIYAEAEKERRDGGEAPPVWSKSSIKQADIALRLSVMVEAMMSMMRAIKTSENLMLRHQRE